LLKMEVPRDENNSPVWLNDDFFLQVIREFTHDPNARLCHGCKLRPGTKPGEHFASVMYRTTIHYRCQQGKEASVDVIMKIKPYQPGLKKDVLEEGDLFLREIRIYSQVLPEMKRRLEEIGETFNYPRLIYASEKPHTILILEDVSAKGWQTGGYITSFEEVVPAIKAIAKFHAASVVMEQDRPNGEVQDTMLIDYQICSWTTPVVDLYYLLDTIVDQSVKEQHRDAMVYLYYEELRRLLHQLGWLGRVTSLQELHIELLRKGAIELFHYVALYPYRFVDRSKIDFEALLSGKGSNPAASSPVYRRVMREVLTKFLHQGVMEP
uniref:CHK kinase-like domain-containing protein n=1 Tax=Anopheles coluzzii TaxID=1518534 RepID=A0A8W7PNJ0_ANOCL